MTLIECMRSEGIRTALEHVVIAQKHGQVACVVDRFLSTTWLETAKEMGVNIARLLVSQPATDAQALDLIGHLEKSRAIDLTVVI